MLIAEGRLDVIGDETKRLQARGQVRRGATALLDTLVHRLHLLAHHGHDGIGVGGAAMQGVDCNQGAGGTDDEAEQKQDQ